MRSTQTLTRHADIQNWVTSRKGIPAIAHERRPSGELLSRLSLRFIGEKDKAVPEPSLDDGMSPCSWSAWLAELDRQQLALQIKDSGATDFEFVERRSLN